MELSDWIVRPMAMVMMVVMDVPARMCHRLMNMLVLVLLGDVQPHADGQERAGNSNLSGKRIAEHRTTSTALHEGSACDLHAIARHSSQGS